MGHDERRNGRTTRRRFVRGTTLAAAGLAVDLRGRGVLGATEKPRLWVVSPVAPDPEPPGVAKFSRDAFKQWQKDNDVAVSYQSMAWTAIRDNIQKLVEPDSSYFDVVYMSGWVPQSSRFLHSIADLIPADLKADLPPSSFAGVTWDGKVYGVVFTLSILTLFFNHEHLRQAGIEAPPATWDDLKRYARELTRDGRYGWVLNYGTAEGIGGVASYWMAFLQQAGGTMFGADGMPAFDDAPGVDALQLMIDLLPTTEPGSLTYGGINDPTTVLMAGKASMMMNWPFMWKPVQDPRTSKIVGQLGGAVLPAGPAGSASIDGTDAWTITARSKRPNLAMKLIGFYLDPEVQKRQVLDSGWLPSRLSVLADPEVQQSATNAGVVLAQAKHPYNSFITPDYDAVTHTLGTELQRALGGQKTARQALRDASDAITGIVKRRPGPS